MLQSVSSDWAPNCPNPYDGLPKRERRERRVICVRSLRTQRAEESFRAEVRRAWPLGAARPAPRPLPASVGATGGALSRCTVSEGEEEAGRGDASLITRRTEETIMRAGGSPTCLTHQDVLRVQTFGMLLCSKPIVILCTHERRSFPSFLVGRSEFAAMKNEERGHAVTQAEKSSERSDRQRDSETRRHDTDTGIDRRDIHFRVSRVPNASAPCSSSPIADLSVRDGGIDAHRQPRLHVEWTTGQMPWAWIQSEKTPIILKIVPNTS